MGFLGRLNPALLALAPLTLLRLRETAHRRIVIASLVAYLGWLAGAHWMRHLLPALPLLALACGSGLHRIAGTSKSPRIIILLSAWTVGIAGIAANLGPLSTRLAVEPMRPWAVISPRPSKACPNANQTRASNICGTTIEAMRLLSMSTNSYRPTPKWRSCSKPTPI